MAPPPGDLLEDSAAALPLRYFGKPDDKETSYPVDHVDFISGLVSENSGGMERLLRAEQGLASFPTRVEDLHLRP